MDVASKVRDFGFKLSTSAQAYMARVRLFNILELQFSYVKMGLIPTPTSWLYCRDW